MIEDAQRLCDRARVLDWNDLRYLLAITRAGTLTGAARDLKVEHTTVGRRLSAMEGALGTKLFTRAPDGLTPTQACRDILPLAEDVAERIGAIERRVSGENERLEGTVRVTTSEAVSGYLVKQLARLQEKHPALVVEILSGNRAFDLMRGEADIAIRVRPDSTPDLIVRKIGRTVWSLYASAAYLERKGTPQSPDDLQGHQIIGFDESLSAVPGALWLQEHALGSQLVLRANSIVAAMNAATVGMGLAVLPCMFADTEPLLRRLTPLALGEREIYLVVHPDLARVARIRAVMEFIIETFRRDELLWTGASA